MSWSNALQVWNQIDFGTLTICIMCYLALFVIAGLPFTDHQSQSKKKKNE